MLSVVMPAAAVRELIAGREGLSVAAVNSPAATVVAGDAGALAELGAELAARHVLRWPVPGSDFTAHSPRVAELEAVLGRELAGITPGPGRVPLYSTVTGEVVRGPELDAGYWYANARQEVGFASAVNALAAAGHRAFIEVSPQPVLTGAVTETLQDSGVPASVVTGTLGRDGNAAESVLGSMASVHVAGIRVDWARVLPAGKRVDLPTYAFQRQRYWPDVDAVMAAMTAGSAAPSGAVAGGDGAGSASEARFWAAVDGGHLRELAEALAVDERRPFSEVLPVLAEWRRRERGELAASSWRYAISWAPAADPGPGKLTGTWLVVAPERAGEPAGEVTAWCAAALAARGAVAVTVRAGGETGREGLPALGRAALA